MRTERSNEIIRIFRALPVKGIGVPAVLGLDVMVILATDEHLAPAVRTDDVRQQPLLLNFLEQILRTGGVAAPELQGLRVRLVMRGNRKEQHLEMFRHLLFSKKRTTRFRPSEVRSEILQQN